MKRSSKRKALPSHDMGTGNVYGDLGINDPEGMLVKAQLVAKIAEILAEHGYTQTRAADILGVPQPKLSKILRGQFRGVSERKLMDCLAKLGRDVDIVVHRASGRRRTARPGAVSVVFA
jgi:predicted XRE-type DNA-binding protein